MAGREKIKEALARNDEKISEQLKGSIRQGSAAGMVRSDSAVVYVGDAVIMKIPFPGRSCRRMCRIWAGSTRYIRPVLWTPWRKSLSPPRGTGHSSLRHTALGKSFAVKAAAGLAGRPLMAVTMHGALSSYELLGGYRPKNVLRAKKKRRKNLMPP